MDKVNKRMKKLRSGKKLREENSVFGEDLDYLLELQNTKIPFVVQDVVHYLERFGMDQEGIFLLPAKKPELAHLRKLYAKDPRVRIDFNVQKYRDPSNIAGLLKLYIKELPQPLVPYGQYNAFLEAENIEDRETRIKAVQELLETMPQSNRNFLIYLGKFLRDVVKHSQKNKMSPQSLGAILSPHMLRTKDETVDWLGSHDSGTIIGFLIEEIDIIAPNIERSDIVDNSSYYNSIRSSTISLVGGNWGGGNSSNSDYSSSDIADPVTELKEELERMAIKEKQMKSKNLRRKRELTMAKEQTESQRNLIENLKKETQEMTDLRFQLEELQKKIESASGREEYR